VCYGHEGRYEFQAVRAMGLAGMGQGPPKPVGFIVARGARGLFPDSKFLP